MNSVVKSAPRPLEEGKALASNPTLSPTERIEVEREVRGRIPLSSPKAKLNTPEMVGYHLHWLNDDGNRIPQAKAGGYSFVEQGETLVNTQDLAGETVGVGTDLGTRVSVWVGKKEDGSPLRAYLMKIPNELYQEDQDALATRVDDLHNAMQQGKQEGQGETEADRRNRYARSTTKSTYSRRSA